MGRKRFLAEESTKDADGFEMNGDHDVFDDLAGFPGNKEDDGVVSGLDDDMSNTMAAGAITPNIIEERRRGRGRTIVEHRHSGSIDPMNIYLREMGNLTLLSHEEEIQLARMIEEGEARVQNSILRLTLGISTLNDMYEGLRSGKMRIGTVLKGLSDNDDETLAAVREDFLACIEKANELNVRRAELYRELKQIAGVADEEERLVRAILDIGLEISVLFKDYHLCSRGIFSVADSVKELGEKFKSETWLGANDADGVLTAVVLTGGVLENM